MTAPPPSPFGPPPQQGVYDPQTNVNPNAPPMTDPAIAAIQSTMQQSQPLLHENAEPSQANAILAPNPPEFLIDYSKDEQAKLLAAALYGTDFPPITESEEPSDWASWARGRWAHHRAPVEKHLHLVERNRLFRAGQQWVSSRGRGPWREPPRPVDSARIVYNLIDKSLDQRLQIITDQRPGFQVEPTTSDPEDKRKAEARQLALEYQFDQQNMDEERSVASFWAQTDGLAFWHTYWDPHAGPWDERMGAEPDQKKPLGDLRTETLRVEQVRVSANATRTEAPYYVLIRKMIPTTDAAYRYGVAGVQPNALNLMSVTDGDTATDAGMNRWTLDQTTIGEGDRMRNQDSVEEYMVYIEPHPDVLPDGLQLLVVGDAVVWGPGPLLFKTIPVVPVRDGSTDPSYYCRPIMEQWIDHQVRINALVSGWVDSIRANKGGRFIARPGAISQETFVGGGTSVMEVNGAIGSLDDVIKPVQGFSVGQDVKDLLQLEIKAFEDASGYNDISRGQIASDASGRAILAAREQLERVFAAPVQSKAMAFTKWAKVQIAGMAFGYDIPRNLGTVGNGRPDLARELTSHDFDGMADVKVDPESLMPMPRVYRQFLLDNWLDKGLITPQQYMRRQPTAMTANASTPDEDQEARAMRICEAIRLGQPVPEMRWQDNEAIHQDILEREIILQDDLQPQVIKAAQQRWSDLANQSSQKQGPAQGSPDANWQAVVSTITNEVVAKAEQVVAQMVEGQNGLLPPPAGAPGSANVGPSSTPGARPPRRSIGSAGARMNAGLTPGTQPLASNNPSAGGAPPIGGQPSDQAQAARSFEALAPQ